MSAADGLVRNEEVAGATPAALTISDGWQSSNAPVSKTERASGLRGGNPYTIRQCPQPLTQGVPMKPVLRFQSQLLFRKSYKPDRTLRIRPTKLQFVFRPARFGAKPQFKTYESEKP